jgi:predicted metal-dependent phosphoesterase TrpH
MLFADLHLHTTESDGTWTPEQLVGQACQIGLGAIAITDHDTTAGIEAAQRNAPQQLQVIPGIELSCVAEDGEEVHIVGLWIDPQYQPLQQELTALRSARIGRIEEILARLADLGISLEQGDVLRFATRDVLSRSHIASALVEKGVVASKKEAFDAYLGQGAPAYVERRKLRPHDAIALIGQSGGVPILAHPGLLQNLTILPSLKEAGLVGLEVIHHSHSPGQTQRYLELAAELELLPSGGSDCHGPKGKDSIYLGKYKIPWKWLGDLAARRARS